MPVEHFRSKEAERRNLSYRHIHGIPYRATYAVVAGKRHKVKHSGRAADRKKKRTIHKGRKPWRKHHSRRQRRRSSR